MKKTWLEKLKLRILFDVVHWGAHFMEPRCGGCAARLQDALTALEAHVETPRG